MVDRCAEMLTCPKEKKRDFGAFPYFEVGVLEVFVRLPAIKLIDGVPAWHGLSEGGQPLLAALQALRPFHHVSKRMQLWKLVELLLVVQPDRAAVQVAEGLAVPQQPVEAQRHLHVLHRLLPLLPGVLVQRVLVGGLQGHQLVPGETPEAVFFILRVDGREEERC